MRSNTRRNRAIAVVGGLSLALTLAACTAPPDDEDEPTAGGDDGGSEVAEGCEAFADYGDLSGTTVTVYTSITSPEDQPHIDSYKPFEECTGATIEYEGSREFEAQLPVRIQAGDPPDIAYIPQPGLLATIVRDNPDAVVPVGEMAEANVDEYYDPAWKGYGSIDGTYYATPLGANVKSFVWYSPSMFADAGYEIPETWDELIALSDQIVADGGKPWCAGIESGEATGWPATDWLEDVMLRTAGPDVYDQWVSHEIPFNDPAVADALETVGSILKNPDYVNAGIGDVRSIASTPFTDAGFPILDGQCWMHRQASFYAANWESAREGVTVAEDGDVFAFYFPSMDPDTRPVLGGGEFVAAFSDRPEVAAFQAYLVSPEWNNAKIEATGPGWVSANSGQDTSLYASPIDKLSAELLADPNTVFRFDASDLMPGEVGAASFWTEMTNWIASDKSNQEVLDAIEASWP
ncbi:ABC transporter substrate-binding protein [Actinotalea fermentans]|uniref:Alpha-glucoside ABC transporter substrate-binding protein n=1 Tax=Actinotalea fermentans TaxID=43671 RepID=A0A511YZ72_9CELL|nr:ABC transporter substrate-binding protein [Actinotalea fermentans]KGM16056.1 sugar ABC transporter substrate-binding protein [Actinotalea fermentans ATCC 43279 = JCM 9966 = DSM 3133]GEN80436.1 alpha-glucoside ABC transporter substrate-binding protein [Actinotalea fermentans]